MDANVTPNVVREFWFGGSDPPEADIEKRIDFWFAAPPDVDVQIQQRFGRVVQEALAGRLDAWKSTSADRLSLVILLDQFPRNIYRGTPKAYSGDEKARDLTVEAIGDGSDRGLTILERAFLYMPLQHAEDGDAQRLSVEMFEQLVAECPHGLTIHMKRFLSSATTHRDIINRFGRFPHRNGVLARECTEAEMEYLRTPAAPFRSKG